VLYVSKINVSFIACAYILQWHVVVRMSNSNAQMANAYRKNGHVMRTTTVVTAVMSPVIAIHYKSKMDAMLDGGSVIKHIGRFTYTHCIRYAYTFKWHYIHIYNYQCRCIPNWARCNGQIDCRGSKPGETDASDEAPANCLACNPIGEITCAYVLH
jgi:hypothetical protein